MAKANRSTTKSTKAELSDREIDRLYKRLENKGPSISTEDAQKPRRCPRFERHIFGEI